MGWTIPKTWAFQEGVESSELNIHLRDNLLAVGPDITRARTTADVTNATTTLANLTGISFAIGASEIWTVALHGMVQIDGTGDYKSNWTVPAGATGHHWNVVANVGASRQDFTTAAVLGVTTTTDYGIDEFATVVNSTTAGTVQFQFALSAASGSDTWRANAFMIATRLS
jgi:hypothetical protein